MAKFVALIDRIAVRFMNDVNDQAIGGIPASIIGTNPVAGQLGDITYLSAAMAAQLSDGAVGTLFEGLYMYAQVVGASTVRGQFVFWSNYENYQVSAAAPAATTIGLWAGVAINVVTQNQYGWFQVGGKASVLFKAAITDATSGDLVVIDQTPSVNGDTVADATTVTAKIAKSIVGVATVAPASSTISTVQITRAPLF